jgi:hypothetical protein
MWPDKPGRTMAILDGATTVKANTMIQENGDILGFYCLVNNVDNACVKLLLDAFDDKFMSAQADPIIRYANETTISLITQLKEWYAFISPIELVDNYEQTIPPYDPSRPIEDLYKQMQDGLTYAQAGDQLYGRHQIIKISYDLIFSTGVYNYACKEWYKYSTVDKTWESFNQHFITERRVYQNQTHTSQASGFHAANQAHRAGASTTLKKPHRFYPY